MSDLQQEKTVQYFVVEGMMTRMDMAMEKLKASSADSLEKMENANKRLLSSLRTVCIALVLAVIIFVVGYTINNNNWIRFVEQLKPMMTEDVTNGAPDISGVYQFTDQGNDPGEDPQRT